MLDSGCNLGAVTCLGAATILSVMMFSAAERAESAPMQAFINVFCLARARSWTTAKGAFQQRSVVSVHIEAIRATAGLSLATLNSLPPNAVVPS